METMINRLGLASAKLPAKSGQKAERFGAASEFTLPPILKPLLNDEPKKKKKKIAGDGSKTTQGQLKNAEANLKETLERFPQARTMMNMRMKDAYKDPHDQMDPHKPSRLVGSDVPSS